jgi:hypothetical protein
MGSRKKKSRAQPQGLGGRIEADTKPQECLNARWGNLFAKSLPHHPLQKLRNLEDALAVRQTSRARSEAYSVAKDLGLVLCFANSVTYFG